MQTRYGVSHHTDPHQQWNMPSPSHPVGQDSDVLSLSSANHISRREITSLLWTTVVWRCRAGGEVDLSAAVTVKRSLCSEVTVWPWEISVSVSVGGLGQVSGLCSASRCNSFKVSIRHALSDFTRLPLNWINTLKWDTFQLKTWCQSPIPQNSGLNVATEAWV